MSNIKSFINNAITKTKIKPKKRLKKIKPNKQNKLNLANLFKMQRNQLQTVKNLLSNQPASEQRPVSESHVSEIPISRVDIDQNIIDEQSINTVDLTIEKLLHRDIFKNNQAAKYFINNYADIFLKSYNTTSINRKYDTLKNFFTHFVIEYPNDINLIKNNFKLINESFNIKTPTPYQHFIKIIDEKPVEAEQKTKKTSSGKKNKRNKRNK